MDQKKANDAFAKPAELPTQLTDEEMEQEGDMDWAINDPEVKRKHADEFVAVYRRHIVAHGQDMKAVLDEAERITGLPRHKIAVTNILGPGLLFAPR